MFAVAATPRTTCQGFSFSRPDRQASNQVRGERREFQYRVFLRTGPVCLSKWKRVHSLHARGSYPYRWVPAGGGPGAPQAFLAPQCHILKTFALLKPVTSHIRHKPSPRSIFTRGIPPARQLAYKAFFSSPATVESGAAASKPCCPPGGPISVKFSHLL